MLDLASTCTILLCSRNIVVLHLSSGAQCIFHYEYKSASYIDDTYGRCLFSTDVLNDLYIIILCFRVKKMKIYIPHVILEILNQHKN